MIKNAYNKTPPFLNGLLIPEYLVEEFYIIIHRLMDKAKDSEDYYDLMWKGEQVREQMKFDFIKGLVDLGSKGLVGEKKNNE